MSVDLENATFAERYDATIAKKLCFECGERKPRVSVHISNEGKRYKTESLWCTECEIQFGWIEDATESVN